MSEPTYIVGIDLGTTNCVLAYTSAALAEDPRSQHPIHVFEISQLVGPGSVTPLQMLPSFIFLPGEHDLKPEDAELPWGGFQGQVVGEFARARGAEIPQRLIASAKSWLCHPLVDRNQAILPWGASNEVHKLSPVEATAALLQHIRLAWNDTMAREDEPLRLEQQDLYLTVPASFDAVARELTVQAAEMAGLSNITLLEEPQAAFYAWIESSGDQWRKAVQPGDLVLVCDLGGGTSDFSLIRVSQEDGDLALERIAVGNHLLVGGDNMDLALAYAVGQRMQEQGNRLDAWQMRALWHSCRSAKEKLLHNPDTDAHPVTILGRGSSLIGGTLKTDLTQELVHQVIVDGFFPVCEAASRPTSTRRAGIQETGLTYEADPAITRHLAGFLSRQEEQPQEMPTAILFNGGVMKATALRQRIMAVLAGWNAPEATLRELPASHFDLAVARGAAYYGLARRGRGIRIRGGLGKSYYIGIAASLPAVPGMPPPMKALCVAPFGMEEGTESELAEREFHLVVGEPVTFEFLASTVRQSDTVGSLIEEWDDQIEPLTTLETTLDGQDGSVIPVTLQVKVTEIGTLELWCVSQQDGRRWKLEFNVRESA